MDANASVNACSCGHDLTNTSMSSTSTDGRSRCSSTSWSQSVVQRRWRSLARAQVPGQLTTEGLFSDYPTAVTAAAQAERSQQLVAFEKRYQSLVDRVDRRTTVIQAAPL
ncbi:hypothetical protein T12_1625 [Trichinella patagoniensis]|uniref:Uncharacterized protein n=1 Tax=Trichinella patagoniensis TaxID=990121 RepID=A0A0V0ZFL6_9BILA|nr:hypothetical protein T12_1625 [Trichinella patagoniensis]